MATWTPKPEDLLRVFDEQNPWHRTGIVPASLAPPIERPLAQVLWKRLAKESPRRFQLVLGPRRVGKSTVLYQTVRHLVSELVEPTRVWWLRLDHPLLLQESLGDLVRTIVAAAKADEKRPVYLMLDEVVYANDWDLWLKTFFDDRWPVRLAATSSATAALRGRRLESGVGRWDEQHLTPYLFPEFLELADVPVTPMTAAATLRDTLRGLPSRGPDEAIQARRRLFMLTGGFPELLTSLAASDQNEGDVLLRSQQILRNDAVERALYKDIPQSFGVDNPMMLERLLYVLAGQMSGILSPRNITNDLGISQPTFDRYLSYLEQAFLVFTLPNYSGKESTVQRRGRKLYFVDGAIRNAALQRGLAPLADPVELGNLMENLVAASLRSLAVHSGVRMFHWRDGRDEVDLVFDQPGAPLAFEIASSADHSRSGLVKFVERHRRFEGAGYLVAPQVSVVHPDESTTGIGTLPTDALLLAVGAQAYTALEVHLGV